MSGSERQRGRVGGLMPAGWLTGRAAGKHTPETLGDALHKTRDITAAVCGVIEDSVNY